VEGPLGDLVPTVEGPLGDLVPATLLRYDQFITSLPCLLTVCKARPTAEVKSGDGVRRQQATTGKGQSTASAPCPPEACFGL
jgi:hypothetical protein